MASKNTEELTKREWINQLIVDSNMEHHRPASREWLKQTTNLSYQAVDEHIKNLKLDQKIYSETPGYYKPILELPVDRAISVTVLNNGMRKVEWGEEYAEFTPHEWATLGSLAEGAAKAMAKREGESSASADLAQLKAMVKTQAARLEELTRTLLGLQKRAQTDMFGA